MPVHMLARWTAAVAAVAAALFVVAQPAHADPPERTVEFRDGSGSAAASVDAGSSAVFYVSDPGLATVLPGTATWTALPSLAPADSWWSLITGAPHPGGFSLVASGYSSSSPAMTPISSMPTAKVDDVPFLLSGLEADAGKFALLNDANTSSSVAIEFDFDVVDFHGADERLVRVASGSDPDGEWLSLTEVVSASDAGASPNSHLFHGEVLFSMEATSVGQGDGAVWVQPGDTITVTYHEQGGIDVVSSHEVQARFVVAGVPSAGPLGLLAAALGFAAAGGVGSQASRPGEVVSLQARLVVSLADIAGHTRNRGGNGVLEDGCGDGHDCDERQGDRGCADARREIVCDGFGHVESLVQRQARCGWEFRVDVLVYLLNRLRPLIVEPS